MNRIYADNAATTKLDTDALNAMMPFLTSEYANPSQPYAFSRESRKAVASSREIIASCIGCNPDQVFFTSGGTESDNWAIKGTAFADTVKKQIVTSAFEHHAVLNSCNEMERFGFPVKYVSPSSDGFILPDALTDVLGEKTRLVSIMYANNELGTIQSIRELCRIAHDNGAYFHTDAVQAVGHIPIDVNRLGVDFLSASAHKFNGPKGIGFLYIRDPSILLQHMSGGAQESGMRAGTENVAAIVGMATALNKNVASISQNISHLESLEVLLLKQLSAAGVSYVCNSTGTHLPGLISLSFDGKDGEAVLHRMDLSGICISTGSACDSKRTQISHVLQAVRMKESLAEGTVRISLGKDNTEADVDSIASALIKAVS